MNAYRLRLSGGSAARWVRTWQGVGHASRCSIKSTAYALKIAKMRRREPRLSSTSTAVPKSFPRRCGDQYDGNPYFVVTVNRGMTPLSADASICRQQYLCQEATRVRQNVFGKRIPMEVRRTKAESEPMSLDIREPPTSGRPVSFAGVVGRGFSIAASVERSVVNVGDPITIRITVRGDGPLDTLALPNAVNLGLKASDFKVAGGQATGILTSDDSKQFNLTARPLHTTVTAVPELTISWFDAEKGQFESARSDPIALSVRAAEVIGSNPL